MQRLLECIVLFYDVGPVSLAAASPRTRTLLELPRPSNRGLVMGGPRHGIVVRLHRSTYGWHDVDARSIEICGEKVPIKLLMARVWWERLHSLRRRLPLRVIAHRLGEPLTLSKDIFGALVSSLDVSGCPARGFNAISVFGDEAGRALEALYMNRCEGVSQLDFVREAPGLRCVHARECLLEDVSALATCPKLTAVHLDRCFQISSVSALSGAPHLRELVLSYSASLRDVEGLARCPALVTVDVQRAYGLTDLRGLAGAPRLERVDASFSGVRCIEGLHTCVCLTEINLTGCLDLTSLAPLGEAPQLRVLHASETGITTLSASLATCPLLETVYADRCAHLTDIDGLRWDPQLRALHVSQSDVRCLQAPSLNDVSASQHGGWCALMHLDLSRNRRLAHVRGLRSARGLRTLVLSGSGLTTVEGLGRCDSLEVLHLERCVKLETLDGLVQDTITTQRMSMPATIAEADTALTRTHLAARSPLRVVLLTGCTALVTLTYTTTQLTWDSLEEIDVCHCTALTDVASLATAAQLQRFRANFSGLESVSGLARCSRLADVQLEGCAFLRSVATLKEVRALRTLLAKDAGIHSLDVTDTSRTNDSSSLLSTAARLSSFAACAALTKVDFDGCEGLKDASAFAHCTALEEARLSWTAVRDLSWVRTCPRLARLVVVGCWRLHSLASLVSTSTAATAAPSTAVPQTLTEVWASQSAVRTLRGLEQCQTLTLLDLRGCADMEPDEVALLSEKAPWVCVRLGDI